MVALPSSIVTCRKAGHTDDADSNRSVMSCVDTLYKDQLPRFLNSLKAPAMYTPGVCFGGPTAVSLP